MVLGPFHGAGFQHSESYNTHLHDFSSGSAAPPVDCNEISWAPIQRGAPAHPSKVELVPRSLTCPRAGSDQAALSTVPVYVSQEGLVINTPQLQETLALT